MEVGQTTAASTSNANAASKNLASNFDDFLTLLTTQLTNQDPLNPTDSTEFTNQLVNFTNVEQSIATNQNLEALVQLQQISQQNSQAATMVNYLGKTVGTNLNVGALSSGNASWNIDLGSSAATATYDIYDKNGIKVYTETTDGAPSGKQTFTWDGTKSNGAAAGDGEYYLTVTAESAGGSVVNVSHNFKGVATSIETVNGEPVLNVGGVKVSLDYITSVEITDEPSA
ncbi:flagellar hook assembly protein FlgD [Sneathiella sp.]|uniref:flagellar hook assembly protein FlgD n=1 Tax=Sneathiella sp. TaxID=1964365 RepID=UPI00356347BB